MEIYALARRDNDCVSGIKDFLGRFHNLDIMRYEDKLYIHRDEKAVRHLFGVASGLDSMVIGEMEILSQVKKAYQDARQASATGKVLNRLFEKAFNTAKRIRTDTFIGRGAVSVSSAAVRLAQKILGELEDKKVLIIGTGTVGEQLIIYLSKNGVKTITVANRSLEKAHALAEKFSANAIAFGDFKNRLADVDIVIASTGAPHCIIHKDDVSALMPERKQKPLFIIDLAVPRDVEEEVNRIDNVYLYNIDDLKRIVDENMRLRQNELEGCSAIIDTAAGNFMAWLVNEKIKNE